MKHKPPAHLRKETAAWWSKVMADYALEEHHVKLLTLAAEAHDRCTEARELLAKHGLTYLDRFKAPRARPEVAVERDSRIAFVRTLRELALDIDEPGDSRPPTIRGNSILRSED